MALAPIVADCMVRARSLGPLVKRGPSGRVAFMTAWSRFREIKAALDSEDIEGLLATGCPSDEYDGEASMIESDVAKITNYGEKPLTVEHCERIVIDVWIRQLGPFKAEDLRMRSSAFLSVARKIAAPQ
jgi:hypothetical protein